MDVKLTYVQNKRALQYFNLFSQKRCFFSGMCTNNADIIVCIVSF